MANCPNCDLLSPINNFEVPPNIEDLKLVWSFVWDDHDWVEEPGPIYSQPPPPPGSVHYLFLGNGSWAIGNYYYWQIDDGICQFTIPSDLGSLLNNCSTLYWRVKQARRGYGDSDYIYGQFKRQKYMKPYLYSPANGASIYTSTVPPTSVYVNFCWRAVPHAQRYYLQVDDNEAFSGQMNFNDYVSGTNQVLYLPLDDPNVPKHYYWRVKSCDDHLLWNSTLGLNNWSNIFDVWIRYQSSGS